MFEDILEKSKTKSPVFAILGDGCWDIYHYGRINRISPEAPVPIFDTEYMKKEIGMAHNVSNNVEKLTGQQLNQIRFIDIRDIKNRYIDLKTNQQVFRIDEKTTMELSGISVYSRFMAYFTKGFLELDGIIISDYNKGSLDIDEISNIIKSAKAKGIPVFLDTKKPDLTEFYGAYIKINEKEYDSLLNKSIPKMIVTRAEKDVLFYPYDNSIVQKFPVKVSKLRDVTGAGDTFLAAFAYALVLTGNINRSIEFAIAASQISIQHNGCYAPTLEEICGTKVK